jgi:hypothetical protein
MGLAASGVPFKRGGVTAALEYLAGEGVERQARQAHQET